jgi:ergothioneine biosynthesis protein EgtB
MAASRQLTLAYLEQFRHCHPDWELIRNAHPDINPPVWELGHIAWFEEHWITRNTMRLMGSDLPAMMSRGSSMWPHADVVFDSSINPFQERGQISLDDIDSVRDYLVQSHAAAMACLEADAPSAGRQRYFYQLSLAHEWMHQESLRMNTQALGMRPPDQDVTVRDALKPVRWPGHRQELTAAVFQWPHPSAEPDEEFFFDNELPLTTYCIEPAQLDVSPVTHGQFADFVADDGYRRPDLWQASGWEWRSRHRADGPKGVRYAAGGIQRLWFGAWCDMHPDSPMIHVSLHEAQAWCQWAGRQLPTEAQWLAGCRMGMDWGQTWEWTADPFRPHPGFQAHPYRDYSAPWFDSHQLVKGCSIFTEPLLKSERYRNFFQAHRTDAAIGFRSVSPGQAAAS